MSETAWRDNWLCLQHPLQSSEFGDVGEMEHLPIVKETGVNGCTRSREFGMRLGLRNAFGESQSVLWRFQCKRLSGERSCTARNMSDALRAEYRHLSGKLTRD